MGLPGPAGLRQQIMAGFPLHGLKKRGFFARFLIPAPVIG